MGVIAPMWAPQVPLAPKSHFDGSWQVLTFGDHDDMMIFGGT